MDDDSIKSLENEKEWRKFLIVEIREIKNEQKEMTKAFNHFKIKIAVVSAFCGSFSAAILNLLKVKL